MQTCHSWSSLKLAEKTTRPSHASSGVLFLADVLILSQMTLTSVSNCASIEWVSMSEVGSARSLPDAGQMVIGIGDKLASKVRLCFEGLSTLQFACKSFVPPSPRCLLTFLPHGQLPVPAHLHTAALGVQSFPQISPDACKCESGC